MNGGDGAGDVAGVPARECELVVTGRFGGGVVIAAGEGDDIVSHRPCFLDASRQRQVVGQVHQGARCDVVVRDIAATVDGIGERGCRRRIGEAGVLGTQMGQAGGQLEADRGALAVVRKLRGDGDRPAELLVGGLCGEVGDRRRGGVIQRSNHVAGVEDAPTGHTRGRRSHCGPRGCSLEVAQRDCRRSMHANTTRRRHLGRDGCSGEIVHELVTGSVVVLAEQPGNLAKVEAVGENGRGHVDQALQHPLVELAPEHRRRGQHSTRIAAQHVESTDDDIAHRRWDRTEHRIGRLGTERQPPDHLHQVERVTVSALQQSNDSSRRSSDAEMSGQQLGRRCGVERGHVDPHRDGTSSRTRPASSTTVPCRHRECSPASM